MMRTSFLEAISELSKGIFNIASRDVTPEKTGVIMFGKNIMFFESMKLVETMYLRMTPDEGLCHIIRHVECGDYHRVLKHHLYGAPFLPCDVCFYHQPLLNLLRSGGKRSFLRDIPEEVRDEVRNSMPRRFPNPDNSAGKQAVSDYVLQEITESSKRIADLKYRLSYRSSGFHALTTELKKAELLGRARKIGYSALDYYRPSVKRSFEYLIYRRRARVEPNPVILLDTSGSMDDTIESAVQQVNSLIHHYDIKIYPFTMQLGKPFIKKPHTTIEPPRADGGTAVWTSLEAVFLKEPGASAYIVITDACTEDNWKLEEVLCVNYPDKLRRTTMLLVGQYLTTEFIKWLKSLGMEVVKMDSYLG